MTVALGMYSIGGILVCADSHVVSTDGIVTDGFKLSGIECGIGTFAIANASSDGNAANMVSKEILDGLASCSDPSTIEPAIKAPMTEWHSGYLQGDRPSTQFVLAVRMGDCDAEIVFLRTTEHRSAKVAQ